MESTPFPLSTAARLFRRPRRRGGLVAEWRPEAQETRTALALFCRDRLRGGRLAAWRAAAAPVSRPRPRL